MLELIRMSEKDFHSIAVLTMENTPAKHVDLAHFLLLT